MDQRQGQIARTTGAVPCVLGQSLQTAWNGNSDLYRVGMDYSSVFPGDYSLDATAGTARGKEVI